MQARHRCLTSSFTERRLRSGAGLDFLLLASLAAKTLEHTLLLLAAASRKQDTDVSHGCVQRGPLGGGAGLDS